MRTIQLKDGRSLELKPGSFTEANLMLKQGNYKAELDERRTLQIAYLGAEPIGFYALTTYPWREESGEVIKAGEVDLVYVKPEQRRHCLGGVLTAAAALEIIVDSKIELLRVIAADQATQHIFEERLGFGPNSVFEIDLSQGREAVRQTFQQYLK